jgi:hypothetical protein
MRSLLFFHIKLLRRRPKKQIKFAFNENINANIDAIIKKSALLSLMYHHDIWNLSLSSPSNTEQNYKFHLPKYEDRATSTHESTSPRILADLRHQTHPIKIFKTNCSRKEILARKKFIEERVSDLCKRHSSRRIYVRPSKFVIINRSNYLNFEHKNFYLG